MITPAIWDDLKKIGISSIARRMGVSRINLYGWKNSKHVPESRLLDLERITGIARHRFRPDLFEGYERNNSL
jgi:hypothetical protein